MDRQRIMVPRAKGKMSMNGPAEVITAAILVIGDEILSGRTKDKNIGYIAEYLTNIGIDLSEVRVVPDIEEEIVTALNALRRRYTYVFTTGGIGPTHDDITTDAVAKAFGVAADYHGEAFSLLQARYGGEFNDMRKRMARVPKGATLIVNPVSIAPGFRIENVFVMAGVPKIMQAMLEDVGRQIEGGPPMISRSIEAHMPEGRIAEGLAAIQKNHQNVTIGSYPSFGEPGIGPKTTLVI